MKLKIVLFVISLSLLGCGTELAPPPAVWQCGYSIKFNKWRCVNSETGKAENRHRDDPIMEGAQALDARDYKAMEAYVDYLKKEARKRCTND